MHQRAPVSIASATIPVAMSLLAFAIVIGHAVLYGVVHER